MCSYMYNCYLSDAVEFWKNSNIGGKAIFIIILLHSTSSFTNRIALFEVGSPMKKIDSHRISGLASRCVEWFDPNIERTNREAPSPSFLQEKIKTLEKPGRS